MSELELTAPSPAALDLVETTPTGLSFKGELTLEEWGRVGEWVGQLSRWSPFAIGDWFVEGEARFGEEWSQYVDEDPFDSAVGVSGQTVRSYAAVCRKLPDSRRHPELDFSHHKLVVAKIEDGREQDAWLERAATLRWSVRDLREALKAAGADRRTDLDVALGKLERTVEWARKRLEEEDLKVFHASLVKFGWGGS